MELPPKQVNIALMMDQITCHFKINKMSHFSKTRFNSFFLYHKLSSSFSIHKNIYLKPIHFKWFIIFNVSGNLNFVTCAPRHKFKMTESQFNEWKDVFHFFFFNFVLVNDEIYTRQARITNNEANKGSRQHERPLPVWRLRLIGIENVWLWQTFTSGCIYGFEHQQPLNTCTSHSASLETCFLFFISF